MDQIISFIRQFIDLFVWWVIIKPWEQGVLVRAGKHVHLLNAGVHLRIPILDSYYIQSTRKRMSVTGRQTVQSADGKSMTFCAAISYSIADVLKLYNTLHHAEDTVRNMTISHLAKIVSTHQSTVSLIEIQTEATKLLNLEQYGLVEVEVMLNELMVTRTYRLVGDYSQTYQNGTGLSTEEEHGVKKS
jgi:regulator of protease activity HflC (stomatin/prohibitin superfamily)